MTSAGSCRVAFSLRPGHTVMVSVPTHLEPALRCLFPDDQADIADVEPDILLKEVPGGRFQLYVGGHAAADPVADRGEGLGQVELMLAEALVTDIPGHRVLHAGGANLDGRAVLLSGHGGSGKSTLSAALALRGLPVFGDDVVLVNLDSGLVSPIRRRLKVMEEPRKALGIQRQGTPLDELWPEAVYLHPSDLGSRWAEPSPVGLVAFPTWSGDPAGEASLTPIPGAASMQRLLFQLLLINRHGAEEVDLIATLLEEARTFEISWGDGHLGARALVEALGR